MRHIMNCELPESPYHPTSMFAGFHNEAQGFPLAEEAVPSNPSRPWPPWRPRRRSRRPQERRQHHGRFGRADQQEEPARGGRRRR